MSGRISNVNLVTPGEEIRPVSISFADDGNISEIAEAKNGKGYALPGFVDIHTHGANGVDLSNATHEAVRTIAEAKLKEGVTTFLPTTWTSSPGLLEEMGRAAAAYRANQEFARTPFLHIEGPYLNPNQAGAQEPQHMRKPDPEEMAKIGSICPIGIVSLAPELEGGIEFVAEMKKRGIVTSAAHSDATYEDFCAAKEAGLTHLTHFCNQMSRLHHRQIGLVGAGLLDRDIMTEMICDTIHLSEDMISLVFQTRPIDRIILITDSIAASHLGDGEYKLNDSIMIVKEGAARIPAGNLAGSTLQYQQGFAHVARITGLPLNELVRTTSYNQAKSLGLNDRGEIKEGKLGDIVILNDELDVEEVYVGGERKV